MSSSDTLTSSDTLAVSNKAGRTGTGPLHSSILPLIQWHDGMALLPHHFQQLDLRWSQVLSHHINLISSHHWGIQDLVIDTLTLPEGLFRILNAEIVLQDGLICHYTSKDARFLPLEVDLRPFKPTSRQNELLIQLVLPARLEGISPIRAAAPRFRSYEGTPVTDENTDDHPVSIPRLVPCLNLTVGETLPANHVGFPVAKVRFVDGAFVRAPYTPPCFQIEEPSHLWDICMETTQKIREKVLALSEKWQNQIGTSLLRETEETLKPLVAMLPTLEALMTSKEASPFELYNELMESAGFIAQLNLSSPPPRFGKYNHNDIDGSILPVVRYIAQCIDHLSLDYAIFPFKKNDRVFSFRLSQSYFDRGSVLCVGLRARPGIQSSQIQTWMNAAVIVSDDALQAVQARRIIGAPRQLIEGDLLYEMMPSRDVTLFAIDLNSPYILQNQYLHIFNPSDTEYDRPVDIVLYVKKDTSEGAGFKRSKAA